MLRIICIVNPAGRDGKSGKRWPKIEERIKSHGIECEAHLTKHVGHASEIAYGLRDRRDIDLVVAVGGDGSVHEVASGLRGSEMKLGIIPMGSGNDYARAHGIPLKDIDQMISILKNGIDRHAGAIRVEASPAPALPKYPSPKQNIWDGNPEEAGQIVRWIFLESDGGVTSAVSRMKTEGKAKWIRGSLKYTYLGVLSILGWKKRKAWIKVNDEDGRIVDLSGLYCFSMTQTFGGGYKVCPGAHPMQDFGSLAMAYGLSKFKMLNLMGPLRKGKHVGKWGITLQEATRFEIKSVDDSDTPTSEPHNPPVWIQADGEPCLTTPANFDFHPNQIWVRGAKSIPNL